MATVLKFPTHFATYMSDEFYPDDGYEAIWHIDDAEAIMIRNGAEIREIGGELEIKRTIKPATE